MKLSIEDAQRMIAEECNGIKELLLEKNKRYGNSVFDPINVFSHVDFEEQIRVRVDDKLKRIMNGYENQQNTGSRTDEDTIDDTIGYLVILKVAIKIKEMVRKITDENET